MLLVRCHRTILYFDIVIAAQLALSMATRVLLNEVQYSYITIQIKSSLTITMNANTRSSNI